MRKKGVRSGEQISDRQEGRGKVIWWAVGPTD